MKPDGRRGGLGTVTTATLTGRVIDETDCVYVQAWRDPAPERQKNKEGPDRALADLSNVLSIFREREMNAEAQEALFKKVLLMTLARAASSDANIDPVELTIVQAIMKRAVNEEVTDADIRLGSRPALFEEAPFGKYLASVRKRLGSAQRASVVCALA